MEESITNSCVIHITPFLKLVNSKDLIIQYIIQVAIFEQNPAIQHFKQNLAIQHLKQNPEMQHLVMYFRSS